MVVRREKQRRRGERTYHGHHTKRKGAGNRGGRGNFSRHKHLLKFIKKKEKGFNYPLRREYKTIDLDELNKLIEKLIEEGKMDKNDVTINLDEFGFNKLLGSGKLKYKAKITVEKASKKALEKVKSLGGEVLIH